METQGWYSVQEFAPGTFQITEGEGNGFRFQSFLFLGEEKALAIDGGLGVANLRELYESITDLPIEFVLTHTHWDHLGAAHLWERVGVNTKGKDLLAVDHTEPARAMLGRIGVPHPEGFDLDAYAIQPCTFGWRLDEGDTFDIGGRRFRVFETPGHSHDSISFLDEKEGVLVTGDLVKPHQILFLQLPTSALSDYGPSLRKLEAVADEVKWICSGHTAPFEDPSILGEMAQFMEEIEAGEHEPPKKMGADYWGIVDEYEAPRFKVWIQDHARR